MTTDWNRKLSSGRLACRVLYIPRIASVVVKTFFRSRDQDLGLRSGLETKTETLAIRSRDQNRDLGLQVSRPRPKPGQNELECTRVLRPYGLEITSLAASIPIGDRALA